MADGWSSAFPCLFLDGKIMAENVKSWERCEALKCCRQQDKQ